MSYYANGRYYGPLCAECDGIGDYLCGYHREVYEEALLVERLAELQDHFYDNMETELLLDQWRVNYDSL